MDGADSTTLHFALNKTFPRRHHPGDARTLGIRAADLRLHSDAEAHNRFTAFHTNAVNNLDETLSMAVRMVSFPISLGIDLHGMCNMNPPCVYCQWDFSKDLEGDRSRLAVDGDTLRQYGPFFACARTLVNCSIGEPLLNPSLPEILESFRLNNQFFEMATNGLALTPRVVNLLLGKKIFFYISLDAGTPETYARIRNDQFDRIAQNLRLLGPKRKLYGGWPKLYMVFMPMRVNRNDLEPFFRLCREIEADYLVLRPLNVLDQPQPVVRRAGHDFDYQAELLTPNEQRDIFLHALEWSKAYGIPVLNQFYFGALPEETHAPGPLNEEAPQGRPDPKDEPQADGDLGHSRYPLCKEPWQNYYILRRGIMPCCYGHAPIAPMEDWDTAWNSQALQDIRAHLREGRFSRYCLESLSCPIVQRHALRREPDTAQVRQPLWLRAAKRVNRLAIGFPGKAWHFLKGK